MGIPELLYQPNQSLLALILALWVEVNEINHQVELDHVQEMHLHHPPLVNLVHLRHDRVLQQILLTGQGAQHQPLPQELVHLLAH